jgi:hypothetical protein
VSREEEKNPPILKKSRIEKNGGRGIRAQTHGGSSRLYLHILATVLFFDMNTIQCPGLSAGCHHGERGERDESSPAVGV